MVKTRLKRMQYLPALTGVRAKTGLDLILCKSQYW
jgi:hypothetical protein